MSGFWRRQDGSKRHRFGLLSRQNEVKREDQARTSWCFLHMLCRWKAKISGFLTQVFKPRPARWADFYIAGDALERFNVTRRILERVEEIARALAALPADIVDWEISRSFGSWSIEFRLDGRRFLLEFDGRDSALILRRLTRKGYSWQETMLLFGSAAESVPAEEIAAAVRREVLRSD